MVLFFPLLSYATVQLQVQLWASLACWVTFPPGKTDSPNLMVQWKNQFFSAELYHLSWVINYYWWLRIIVPCQLWVLVVSALERSHGNPPRRYDRKCTRYNITVNNNGQDSFFSPVFTPLLDLRQQLFENLFNRPVDIARSHIHKREFYFRYPLVRVKSRIKVTTWG